MRHFKDFAVSGQSFHDRVGDPDEFDAAIGRIALGFSFLEETARNVIILLAGIDLAAGQILTAELSFRQKVDLLGALIRHRQSPVPPGSSIDAEAAIELLHLCRRAEGFRNSYLHSSYVAEKRSKLSAKAKQGLRLKLETASPSVLLDVADFIEYVGMQLEGLPLLVGVADLVTGGHDCVTYMKRDVPILTFRFGELGKQP